MKDRVYQIQVLKENWGLYGERESGTSFYDYVKNNSESDPSFFYSMYGEHADEFGSGLTDEEKEDFEQFLEECREVDNNTFKVICSTDEYHAAQYKARGFDRSGKMLLAEYFEREEAEKRLLDELSKKLEFKLSSWSEAVKYEEEHSGVHEFDLNINPDGTIQGFSIDVFKWYIHRELTEAERAEMERKVDEAREEMKNIQAERSERIDNIRKAVGDSVADVTAMYDEADNQTKDIIKGDKRRKRRKELFKLAFSKRFGIDADFADVKEAFRKEFHEKGIY